MKRTFKYMALLATGASMLQFGGCVANILSDVFFFVGPFLL